MKPLVAIIGRPNVGKSTFFNKMVGRKASIVKNEPGVTRDRIYGDSEWTGHQFSLVDTGGLDVKNKDEFQLNITRQAEIAVELADVVILIVDGKEGVTSADHDAANFLRKFDVPVVLAVNKLDNNEVEKSYDFYELGLGEPYPISAEHSLGFGDLLDAVVKYFKTPTTQDEDVETLKVAVVGKPNAGKSSLVNRLLGENRVMVSNIAGTTRDAVDTPFMYNGKKYILIDTAGIRRKRNIDENSVEAYSTIRSFDAIRRADVVIVVIDAMDGITEQDLRILGFVHEEGKPSVILMNKWDTIKKDEKTMNYYNEKMAKELKFMSYFVTVYASVLTGQRVGQIMEKVELVYEHASHRISTGVLNDILHNAILTNEPPTRNGRRLKISYVTQASVTPPTFVFFVNDIELMHFSYERYLENCIRSAVDYSGTPIRFILREKGNRE